MRVPDLRYQLWLGALAALATLPLLAGFAGLGWELAQVAGLLGLLACVLLCGAALRPRDAQPPTLFSLRAHTLLGWAALAAVVLHTGGLVLADRTVLEYLKLSMPLYQWAGLIATVLIAILVLSGGGRARRALWRSHRAFQAMHVCLSCAVLVLAAAHVLTTDRYVGGGARRALLVAVSAGALLMLLRARRGASVSAHRGWRQALVFGRHSTLALLVIGLAVLLLAGLAGGVVRAALREPLLGRTATLPLDFPHEKHGLVNCLECHHNYADGTGLDWCVHCHRSARFDLKEGAEARFHGFCFQCHRHPQAGLQGHGPVSGCATCHRRAERPMIMPPAHVPVPPG